ncbi:MAG TPA: hypothetical protein DDZ39_03805 [Flavobacteriaceae bacterium]|jgi:uncharacterized membrane protein YdbT with pleckstrin-like domain|nr:hypothetical protein [Flavobacteriaceae bacterium]
MRTQLKNNEKVVLIIKKHWFSLFPSIRGLFIFLIGFIFLPIIIIFPFFWIIYKIVDRHYNLWIVTNLRIINEYGVFSVNSKETPLDKINNVSYRKSFFGRLFGFGNVIIQSAAETGATTHFLIEKPQLLKDTISEYQERYKKDKISNQFQNFSDVVKITNTSTSLNITKELKKLYVLKEKGIISEIEFEKGKSKILDS